jgi:hypothetical protein
MAWWAGACGPTTVTLTTVLNAEAYNRNSLRNSVSVRGDGGAANSDLSMRDVRDILEQARLERDAALKCPIPAQSVLSFAASRAVDAHGVAKASPPFGLPSRTQGVPPPATKPTLHVRSWPHRTNRRKARRAEHLRLAARRFSCVNRLLLPSGCASCSFVRARVVGYLAPGRPRAPRGLFVCAIARLSGSGVRGHRGSGSAKRLGSRVASSGSSAAFFARLYITCHHQRPGCGCRSYSRRRQTALLCCDRAAINLGPA